MRWLFFIWMLYIVALTAMPCGDAGNQCDNGSLKTLTTVSHNHYQDNNDKCSPFCNCSCCSISITSSNFKPFEMRQQKMSFSAKKIMLQDESLISRYFGYIWNPPKFTV